ncbi:thioredoxin fold domain-containing protein [Aquimarina gracilis]|uniref:Thioredoxin fold domain-containing protein n=2 Tax=Aquimarina gracilis TaxID=874422 RepID=A0ABU5ZS82_9FLAO|nr:thioredoxin fold domain-containing protein [Aquimarina gracilis]MEB3344508.1 thioredoxin fold domain-containing protein [Aquimarina gracilis]
MKHLKIILFFLLASSIKTLAQKNDTINWINFEQLDDSLAIKPKKVIISFYADWCVYCKKMDRVVFTKPKIIEKITKEYYAVKMNAESKDSVYFDGTIFTNKGHLTSRNSIHEIPILLASREGYPFSLPAIIFLDENFKVRKRYFEYMSPKKLLSSL